MPLKSDNEGCYTATWVPGTSGTYLIQVFIDNKHTGVYNTIISYTEPIIIQSSMA